tara:strand:- start:437 stop:826 length:390 start_codon:yes stop_codon:yes gene_type:complete
MNDIITFKAIVRAANNKPAGSAGKDSWTEYCTLSLEPKLPTEAVPNIFSATPKSFQYNKKEHGSLCIVNRYPKDFVFPNGTICNSIYYKVIGWCNNTKELLDDLKADDEVDKVLEKRRKRFSIPKRKSK